MSEILDRLDRRILFELDCNSRQSLSELSRKVRLGRDLVSYRVEKLARTGVLKKCGAMINPYKLGLTVYKTYMKLEAQKDRWQEFVAFLDAHPRTLWLAETYGTWDVVWSVLARTPKEVYDLHDAAFSKFHDVLVGYTVCTLVNYFWFPKKYLIGGSAEERPGFQFELPEFTFGNTPDHYELDELEYALVSLLTKDAQTSTVELARQLKVTPAIVTYRIQKLEQLGAIAGYRVDLDREKLGMTVFKVQVHPRDFDGTKEAEFHQFCRLHPQISAYFQQLGECKVEFEVEARSYEDFNRVIDEVREKFSGFIRSLNYIMVRRDYFYRTPCNVFLGRDVPSGSGYDLAV